MALSSRQALPRPVKESVVRALPEVLVGSVTASSAVRREVEGHPKWGARDRRQFAEAMYGIVRQWRALASRVASASVPWAAVGADVLLEEWLKGPEPDGSGLVSAVSASWPDFLWEMGQKQWPEDWPQVAASLDQPAGVFLRVNVLRTTAAAAMERLGREGLSVERVDGHPQAIRLLARQNLAHSPTWRDGWVEVQDLSSQAVAPLLTPQPGQRVIDLCAGGGGKSLHLAALMENRGKIVSMDVHEWKLKELQQRASRARVGIIETVMAPSLRVESPSWAGWADAVLVDAPCSGLGTQRRHPEVKWRVTAERLAELAPLQQGLLKRGAVWTRPGGRLVYATCSILSVENDAVVERFLSSPEGAGWRLLTQQTVLPTEGGGDGFFLAALERRAGDE